VDEHEVVDDTVGLEEVAVAIGVRGVLDVVVRPGKLGFWAASVLTASMPREAAPAGLSGCPLSSCSAPGCHTPGETSMQVSMPYHASECGTWTHGVAWPSTVYLPLDISVYMLCIV
jgi:hypothetical protein